MLSLDKVVDVIRYFAASTKVTSLYKVKLMKLMWYADALAYKNRGFAITGLVYQALPMGAIPVGHNFIIDLKDVPCEEVDMGETNAYYFAIKEATVFPALSDEDIEIFHDTNFIFYDITPRKRLIFGCFAGISIFRRNF